MGWRPRPGTKLLLSVGLLFIVGLALAALPWDQWINIPKVPSMQELARRLPRALGEALMIAQLLILIVDQAAKRDLLREFTKNISGHIIGHHLPDELRDNIEDQLTSNFVRKNWVITYNIKPWEGQPGFEKLETIIDYDMENRTDVHCAYLFAYEVEESFVPHLHKAKITLCTGKTIQPEDQKGNLFNYPRDRNIDFVESDDDGSNKLTRVKKEVNIAPKGVCRFTAESEECFRDGSSIPFFAFSPVLPPTKLIVNYNKASLEVFVDLSFGDEKEDTISEETETGKAWTIKKPILRGQGFTVRLYQRNAARPAVV